MTLVPKALVRLPFRRKSVFRYPMEPAPRTAVLAACFRQPMLPMLRPNYPVRVFPQGWSEEVSAFAPAAVAAPREQLLGLAAAERPPAFTHAVIALESPGDPLLSAVERERLWRAFRVPVIYREYEMGHEINAESLADLTQWLDDKIRSPIIRI